MLDPRHDARGRPSRAKPGDARVRLCTAADEHRADAIVRSLAVYELPCTARKTREKPVDLYVRGSDLERARRIVKKLARS